MIKVSHKGREGGGLWVSKTDIKQVNMKLSGTISISVLYFLKERGELSCRTHCLGYQ